MVALCSYLGLVWSGPAGAQSDQERAGARVAGREGVEAYQRGDYEKALELLERAQSLVDAPTHLLFIARSQVKLGRLVEAREAYRKILVMNLPPSAPEAFRAAQEAAPGELEEIEARIGQLKIEVTTTSGGAPEGLEVKLNGEPLSAALVGLSVPANPGMNEVEARAPGMKVTMKTVELRDGESAVLELVLTPEVSGEKSSGDERDSSEEGGSHGRRKVGWILAGGGAAVGAAGGVLGILSMNQLSRARKDEDLCGADKVCTADGRAEVKSAFTKALIGDISMGVGILAVGVGTYLIVSDKPNPQKVGLRSLVPIADQRGGYLVLEGGF